MATSLWHKIWQAIVLKATETFRTLSSRVFIFNRNVATVRRHDYIFALKVLQGQKIRQRDPKNFLSSTKSLWTPCRTA